MGGIVSGAVSTSQVLNAYAGASGGGVGTYMSGTSTVVTQKFSVGNTRSSIYAGPDFAVPPSTYGGTWMALGCMPGSVTWGLCNVYPMYLWLRIA